MNSGSGCKSYYLPAEKQERNMNENMKGQDGDVLSAKAEFIAPRFTLSHRFFGCLSHLEVRTLPAFLVGFVLGFWVLFGSSRFVARFVSLSFTSLR